MSSQAELNANPQQFVLYYCGVTHADATVYQTDLSDVCTLGFDGSDNIEITGWLIGGYGAPSPATLMTYALATVLAFYDNFYAIPAAIHGEQPYQISAASLAAIRSDAELLGCIVFDTTASTLRTWSGSAWETGAQRFLLLSGANSMAGNIALGSYKLTMQGAPADVSIYSGYTPIAINNDATETSITPASGNLGSMVLAAGQPVGMVLEFVIYFVVSSVLGDTLTVRIKTQDGTLYTNALTVGALASNLSLRVKGHMTIQAATSQISSLTRTASLNYITSSNATYDPAVQNTLDITAQWGGSASSCSMTQIYISGHFRNG